MHACISQSTQFCKLTHSWVEIKLVLIIGNIEEDDGDDGPIAIIVDPVSHSGGQRNDITLSEAADLLVLILEPPAFSSSHLSSLSELQPEL